MKREMNRLTAHQRIVAAINADRARRGVALRLENEAFLPAEVYRALEKIADEQRQTLSGAAVATENLND